MDKNLIEKYKKCMHQLVVFFEKNNMKMKPYPLVKLNNKSQPDEITAKTGYYDPSSKTIVVFINHRFFKDCMRSFAHELVHHCQNLEGHLAEGSYEGQDIINDDRLMNLEKEAYLKGNILFRSWTESIQQEIESEPTEHMRKLIKLNNK